MESSEYESDEAPSDRRRKSRATKKARVESTITILKWEPAFATHAAVTDVGLDRLDMTIDDSTKNTSHFIDLVQHQGLRATEDAMTGSVYTPSSTEAMHVYDMPLYDAEGRFYELIEDSVALVDYEQPDGPKEIELYVMHVIVKLIGSRICPWCFQNNRNRCNKGQPACNVCQIAGRGAQCATEQAALVNRKWNTFTKETCNDRAKIVQLGRITVDMTNRVSLDLEIARWERIDSNARGEATVLTVRTFITITSLVRWKQIHHPDFDLADLNGYGEAVHTSVSTVVEPWGRFGYTKLMAYSRKVASKKKGYIRTILPPAIHCTSEKPPTFSTSPLDIDVETVKALPSMDTYHVFGGEPVQGASSESLAKIDLNNPSKRAATKALQTIMVEMVGMIGTFAQLALSLSDKVKSHMKHTRRLSSNKSGGGGYAKGP
ncbi:hypothetical protein PtrSN002B_005522 [Pyrenophora tritici-repentis]|nr:hypothetical protein PtrSN002B_005522 [Pyrenophora tritici-repentis]KAI1576880.1 hypothetical protein PtrEW7m1_006096 [Pyrenophora tritici-repentis]KAI1590660.1 hypothetical protein PtrEW13061_005255 [Pyrenophora tritici-repentis]KAI1596610.1 hypothetical protein PtrCC142_009509 [Pyrenophora tritici-repentis]PZD26904.1 hypothetical protein A1F96_07197 [Pyrenophora tritici-repentis]